MSILSSIPAIINLVGSVGTRLFPDRQKANETQTRTNDQEISGAPKSFLRLWRSFLGWVLSLIFLWEVVIRAALLTYFPEISLPPSALKEVSAILLGMLGLSW